MLWGPVAEVIVGSSLDPEMGPVLLFGSGGALAEGLRDRALALPPLHRAHAAHLIDRTRVGLALRSRKQFEPQMKQLEELLVRFSRIVEEQPWITEIEMNPLVLTESGCHAIDARMILMGPAEKRPTNDSSP